MEQPRVVFAHGLESGPQGSKAKYLANHFDTSTPDLQMSAYNPLKANSPARIILGYIAAGVGLCIALPPPGRYYVGAAWLALSVFIVRWGLRRSLARCACILAAEIELVKPDVCIGSSWGGAVLLRCMSDGAWSGPSVLLAPAIAAAGCWGWLWPRHSPAIPTSAAQRCLVVQGCLDDTVPASEVHAWSKQVGMRCLMLEDGDHRLNDALLDTNLLPRLVNDVHTGASSVEGLETCVLQPLVNDVHTGASSAECQ